uniref:dUTPase-like domain-containing protein n=1 Tax=Physcomitrium patens TaxID=3218 RepID=A0A2K1KZM6_PHYPA|nr:hypothetical protein PHYPA_002019 [Physcomitrium patens]
MVSSLANCWTLASRIKSVETTKRSSQYLASTRVQPQGCFFHKGLTNVPPLQASRPFDVPVFNQALHATSTTVACPSNCYIQVEPWQRLAQQGDGLVVHGLNDQRYQGQLKILIANLTSAPIHISSS